MATTHAMGFNIRHAVTRALATANLDPREATYKILAARVWLNARREVARGEVTVSIRRPQPLPEWEPQELSCWVNPDGEHPEMVAARIPELIFVDIFPVTWQRWLAVNAHESLPTGIDPFHPRTHLEREEIAAWARAQGRRLPRSEEFLRLWGRRRFPWGDEADPEMGRASAPRFGQTAEVGLYPPIGGLFDLGAWLWQMLEDGGFAGVVSGPRPRIEAPPPDEPAGFRLVADVP